MKKIFLIIFMFILVFPLVFAKQGHMQLLAVKEGVEEGSVADLYLEIEQGNGRVFIETVPLSKLDTQISTRFAKEIACDFIEKDCSRYDFFYTINSNSPIIGGPSAGGAIAVLTAAVLENDEVDSSIAMTGTINSGGLIGPVGGLKEKISAAGSEGIKTVLIPAGERFLTEDNLTLDLVDYAKKHNVAVVEVGELRDAMHYFTGMEIEEDVEDITISSDYQETMKFLAEDLCDRAILLNSKIGKMKIDSSFKEKKESAINLSVKGSNALNNKKYYSAASYCFGANVRYQGLIVKLNEGKSILEVGFDIEKFNTDLASKEIKTITDLQAYMVVKERLKDTSDSLKEVKKLKEEGDNYSMELGYTIERLYSATSWSNFFGVNGKKFSLDKESLRESCLKKLGEAEERFQYASLYFPLTLENIRKELYHAYSNSEDEEYALCLFKASKAKAESDTILGVIGVGEEQIDKVLSNKLEAVKRVIVKQEEVFPILGYSYYEYADVLKENDKGSAFLYAEYALEMSNLDIYFSQKKIKLPNLDYSKIGLFLGGVLVGGLIVSLFKKHKKKRK